MKTYSLEFYDWLEMYYPFTDVFRFHLNEFRDIVTGEWFVVYRHIYN